MSIRGFGNIVPIHGSILSLIGWNLTRGGSNIIADSEERIEEMRRGHAELVADTGQDFGFDLSAWREYLLANEQTGYTHPYAFEAVDRAVRSAMTDQTFLRLAGVAASEN